MFKKLIAKLKRPKIELNTMPQETVYVHARFDDLDARLAKVLHRLNRQVSSKSERTHLTHVKDTK